jgi:hypothetical protein
MSSERERLFRDDAGAAIERAARLEDENRRLREELQRLTGTSTSTTPTPGEMLEVPSPRRRADDRMIAVVVLGMVTAFAGMMLGMRAEHSCSFSSPSRRTTVVRRPTPIPIMVKGEECADPYRIDEGIRRIKPECLPGQWNLTSERLQAGSPHEKKTEDCAPPWVMAPDGVRRYKPGCF